MKLIHQLIYEDRQTMANTISLNRKSSKINDLLVFVFKWWWIL